MVREDGERGRDGQKVGERGREEFLAGNLWGGQSIKVLNES